MIDELYYKTNGDTNHDTWIINIRALLRPQGLWACTQDPLPEGASAALRNQHVASADMITPYVSAEVKAKLPRNAFDDGYLMLSEIKKIVPTPEQIFFASARELFSLRLGYGNTKTLDSFLARIKFLNERIDSTKIEFTTDKFTIVALMLSLNDQYGPLVSTWSTIPDLTAERAMQMLRVFDYSLPRREAQQFKKRRLER